MPNSCVQTQRGKEQTFVWKQLKGKQSGLNQVWIENTGAKAVSTSHRLPAHIQRSCLSHTYQQRATEPLYTPEECSTKYNIYRNIHNSMGSSCTQGHLKNNKIKTTDCLNTDQPIKTLRKTIYKRHMCRSETPTIAVITHSNILQKKNQDCSQDPSANKIQTLVALHVS